MLLTYPLGSFLVPITGVVTECVGWGGGGAIVSMNICVEITGHAHFSIVLQTESLTGPGVHGFS